MQEQRYQAAKTKGFKTLGFKILHLSRGKASRIQLLEP
jgi:hypothetical protein